MSARDTILQSIKINQPQPIALPVIDIDAVITYPDIVQQYKAVLESIGGQWEEVNNEDEIGPWIEHTIKNKNRVINTLTTPVSDLIKLTADDLEAVDVAIMQGTVAVAENGSIWLSETQMKNRLLPFICQQLVIIIQTKNMVHTMHHAYKKINITETGFGVFIAGPSKTADIEQSLVIGAHGPVGLKVLIVTG
jgi:L-lactate dehydrogenase complex protein LldG